LSPKAVRVCGISTEIVFTPVAEPTSFSETCEHDASIATANKRDNFFIIDILGY
jgi:hypothetical protein